MVPTNTQQHTEWTTKDAADFFLKWTPRALAIGVGAYYGLGVAYDLGVMAAIDRVAMDVLKQSVGYVGIGALMPTIQWYSAWAVRIVMATIAGLLYDLAERVATYVYRQLCTARA
jgi:hypothetical protein